MFTKQSLGTENGLRWVRPGTISGVPEPYEYIRVWVWVPILAMGMGTDTIFGYHKGTVWGVRVWVLEYPGYPGTNTGTKEGTWVRVTDYGYIIWVLIG